MPVHEPTIRVRTLWNTAKQESAVRNANIVADRAAGMSLRELAAKYTLSHQRIARILKQEAANAQRPGC